MLALRLTRSRRTATIFRAYATRGQRFIDSGDCIVLAGVSIRRRRGLLERGARHPLRRDRRRSGSRRRHRERRLCGERWSSRVGWRNGLGGRGRGLDGQRWFRRGTRFRQLEGERRRGRGRELRCGRSGRNRDLAGRNLDVHTVGRSGKHHPAPRRRVGRAGFLPNQRHGRSLRPDGDRARSRTRAGHLPGAWRREPSGDAHRRQHDVGDEHHVVHAVGLRRDGCREAGIGASLHRRRQGAGRLALAQRYATFHGRCTKTAPPGRWPTRGPRS
jgi:hypothetical protein